MNSHTNGIDITPWQSTFEKQQRLILKREQRAKEEAGNNVKTSIVDTSPGVSNDSKGVRPRPGPASVCAAAVGTKPTVAPIPVKNMSDDSDVDEVSARVSSPATKPPNKTDPLSKSRLSSSITTAFMDNDDDQELICRAMTSFVISSPPREPGQSAPTTSPFTSPGKRRKYYVVSAGKRTGVFDSWPYVQSLTSGVSGNCQKSYATYDEALEVYQDLKANGLLRIIRNRGDENLFGPVEDAIE